MIRALFALTVLLALAAAAEAGHRSLFGFSRERVVVRERRVERGPIRAALGMTGGGCIGTAAARPVVAAGCSGYTGPALNVVPAKAVPAPMPPARPYWPGIVPWKK